MLRVGLTGGIGAGKSTVAARLAELVEAFGEDILAGDGALDRQALAARAFADDESRTRLNGILHPRIGARTAELMNEAAPDAIVVHDIPLLVEGGLSAHYHLTIVVDAPPETRVRRLVESRGMAEEDARARIAAQATEEQRRAAADVWLDNGGQEDAVLAEVDALWADRLVPFEANIRLHRPRPPRSPALSPHDDEWPRQAERALARIRIAAGEAAHRVDHIGSTSIPGLPAKDILDLQLTTATLADADAIADALTSAGFPRASGEWYDDPVGAGTEVLPKRFHFGGDPQRPVNLHVRSLETPAWRLALLFADYLRANPDERDAYAEVKRELAEKHAADGSVEAYADEKQHWVNSAFGRAEEWAVHTGWTVN